MCHLKAFLPEKGNFYKYLRSMAEQENNWCKFELNNNAIRSKCDSSDWLQNKKLQQDLGERLFQKGQTNPILQSLEQKAYYLLKSGVLCIRTD